MEATWAPRKILAEERFSSLLFPLLHRKNMTDRNATIYVIDDDESIRDSLGSLLRSVGFQVEVFASTESFLIFPRKDVSSCLVLDVRLPGSSGVEFQEHLKKAGIEIPIIFITAHGDIPMTSRAIKAGAIEFLTKPFQKEDLLVAVDHAFTLDRNRRHKDNILRSLRQRIDSLTDREREVMAMVTAGLLNKQIAADLSLSEITVKLHRRHVMDKMKAASLADLVKMCELAKPHS